MVSFSTFSLTCEVVELVLEKHCGTLKSLLIEQTGMSGCEADALFSFQTNMQTVRSGF